MKNDEDLPNNPSLPTISETCEGVVPVEEPRYKIVEPLVKGIFFIPFIIQAASLLRYGSQIRNS